MSELEYKPKYAFEEATKTEKKKIFDFSEKYKEFLNYATTERRCVKRGIELAEEKGFKPLEKLNMIGAHIDSPRLDLKPMPLYDDSKIAYFKTHYYGGIKKYQWTTIPLALYGKIVKKDGEVDVEIDGEDFALVISDLLPHLASEQMKKTMSAGIEGEQLNLIVGSRTDDADDNLKENILKILNEKYGITEEDFISSELEAVPAIKARDVGFDRSIVGGYGQDDRVCAFPDRYRYQSGRYYRKVFLHRSRYGYCSW